MTKPGYGIEMYCMQLCGIPVINSNRGRCDKLGRGKIRREDMDTRALGRIPELYLGLFRSFG